jgi:hypothetical protein
MLEPGRVSGTPHGKGAAPDHGCPAGYPAARALCPCARACRGGENVGVARSSRQMRSAPGGAARGTVKQRRGALACRGGASTVSVRFRCGSGAVPVRFRCGSGAVPVRFRCGSGAVPGGSGRFRDGSGRFRAVPGGSGRFRAVLGGSRTGPAAARPPRPTPRPRSRRPPPSPARSGSSGSPPAHSAVPPRRGRVHRGRRAARRGR